MAELKPIIFGSIVITLFAFLLIQAVIEGGEPYGKGIDDISEETNISGLTQTLETIQGKSEEWEGSVYGFQEKGIIESVLGFLASTFFKIFLGIFQVIITPFKGMIFLFSDILGLPAAVSSTLVAVVIIAMIFGIYKIVRQGA